MRVRVYFLRLVRLVYGFALLSKGNVVTVHPSTLYAGLSMIGLGLLMFIPGSYGSVVLFGAYNRWEGYSYNQIPNYGDDQ